MKRTLLYLSMILILASCSGKKQVARALHSGNYDHAMQEALERLRTNKDSRRKQDYILMLSDAYYKAVERDLGDVKYLKHDDNPENYKQLYEIFVDLNQRQNSIKPLLPLYVDGKKIDFKFNDYNASLIKYKNKTSDYLYEQGLKLLESDDKLKIREAHSIYDYIENINPNYDDTRKLLEEAHLRGTDHIVVSVVNQTDQVIPNRLEADLMDFNTYSLNQYWTQYHSNQSGPLDFKYDLGMQLQLKRILVSPEQVDSREILRERRIKDGWEYKKDRNGNVMKDSLGNDIKIDVFKTVRARFFEVEQRKTSQILAEAVYMDLNGNQIIDHFPIDSGFNFMNIYATFRGDKRALTDDDIRLLNNRQVIFPSNEQMVYDTGEDLKAKLKSVISRYRVQ